ncbi:MAG: tetratricopeptide repeat protein, partial [Myxococcota bacterium]|nr:tetratricopeptide repeat protein [Myxococcota bacterium]
EWESASTTYERLARQSSGTLKAHFLYRKATLQESRLFEEQEAVHTLHSVLALNPNDRSARVSLLRILLKQKSLLSESKNASLFSGTVFEYRKFVAELEDRPTQAWKHLSTEGALFWFRIQKMPLEKKREQLRNYLSFAQGMDETIALWYLSSIDPEFAQKGLANLCEKDAAALFVVNALGTDFMTSCAWASKLAASDPVVAISILCTILIQEGLPQDEYEISALADALEDIEHPDVSVLKELIFIMDDRALPLAALYSRRAKANDDPNWKAHWLVQAARYSEDAQALELYREAQQINSAMSIGYTEQYTRLIRSGEFLGALEMLQLQSKLTLPAAYLFVGQILSANPNRELHVSKGQWGRLSNYRNACRNNNTRKIYESLKIFGDELSPRAQLWAYIDLVYREMDKNILVKVLTEGQALPSSIRVAAVLSNLSLRVPDLTSLLRQILKNDKEDTESQLLLLSIALERKEKNLIPMLVQGLQVDADAKGQLSILLEAEEDWQSALSCCESESEKAEIIDAYLPERREEVWAGVFQSEPSIKSAFGLIGCGANLREAYEWIAKSAGETKPKIAFSNYAATLALRHGDIGIAREHFSYSFKHEPFEGRSFYGLKQIALMEKNGELLKEVYSSLGNEIWAEYALGLELVEEYESSITLYDKHLKKLKNTPQYPIITCKLERLCEKNGEWERLYELLNERRGIWRSSEGITEIETKLRWLMLEHLPHKPETLIFFKELSNKYPRNIEIAEALARISISHGDYHEGIEALKRLLEGSKEAHKGAKYYYYIADAYLKMKEVGQGISYLQKSIHLDFYNEQARQTLKSIFYEQSQYGDLIQLLGFEGERLQPEQRKESLVELAKLYSETLKRYDDAIDIWSKLWQVDQGNQHILEELINISHRSGDLKKQIKYIKSSLQIQEDPSLRLRLAFIYKDSVKDPSKALVHFEKAAQNLETQEEALLELNNLYRERGDIPKYIETLQKRAGLADGVSNKINLLEEVFSDGDELGTDINLYPICESILALDPMHQRALSYVADVAFEREDWDKCMTVFANLKPLKEALKLNSFEAQLNYSEFFFRYGVVLLKVGEQSEGIDVLTQLHKRFPNHLNTLQVLGQALLESSDWERAADIFRRQLMAVGGSNSAQTAEVYYQLGFIEHKRGSYKEAAHYYMKARKLNPTNLKIYKGLADISMETQSWTRSLHIYQKIIESQQATHQDIRDGMLVKAWILDKKLERSEAAFKHYEKSHQFDPKQPIVILRLGEFYLDVNPQKALICVDKALGLLKDSSPSLVRLGHGIRYLCLIGLRKSVESEAELRFLSDTGPSVESWVKAELAELIV